MGCVCGVLRLVAGPEEARGHGVSTGLRVAVLVSSQALA